ncbi:hypothetical protein P7C71_g4695, partial [Lecanoromycetidae sp. Uapishka_2]
MSDVALSARDLEIIQKVFQCFRSPDALKIDTDKLAQLAGFANGRSANTSWLIIKKKLLGNVGDASTKGDEGTPAKASPNKAARTIKAKTPGEGEADDETTPSPKKKPGRKPKTALATEVKNEDNDENTNAEVAPEEAAPSIPTPKKKRTRGPNKVKDPNAPVSKRAKKNAKGDVTAAAATPNGVNDEAVEDSPAVKGEAASLFGDGTNKIKTEQELEDDEILDEDDQKYVDEQLETLRAQNPEVEA